MSTRPFIAAALAASAVLVTACASETPYVRPALAVPAAYPQAASAPATVAASEAAAEGAWWKRFNDPTLDALVDEALKRNNTLAQSLIAVEKARLQVGETAVNPTFSGSVTGTGITPVNGKTPWLQTYGTGATVSYELDLFGELKATKDVARFEAKATAQDYAAARLTLIGTVVQDYYQLAYLNQRIALAQDSVAYGQKSLDLTTALRRAGADSDLDVAEAQQSLQTQQSTLEDLIRQRVDARNAIDLLLDGEHWTPPAEPVGEGDAALPPVAVGLPAELLARRPDLRAAELRLREQLRQEDATRLSFYPQITLTGELGTSTTQLGDLLKNPAGTLGANLLLPFLQADQVRLQNKSAKLAYDNAVIGFRQTLYQALVDVDNALADRTHYATETQLLSQSLTEARRVEKLDETLFRAGSGTMLTWLQAQDTRRQNEASLAQSLLSERLAQSTLYQALGGDA